MNEPYVFNKTWQDKIHPHSVNWPKEIWELICQDAKRLHTSKGDIIRERLRESYCKDKLATRQDFKDSQVEWQHGRPKRYQGRMGLRQRFLGVFFKDRRLKELERAKEAMKQIFSQKDLS